MKRRCHDGSTTNSDTVIVIFIMMGIQKGNSVQIWLGDAPKFAPFPRGI